MAGGLKKDLTSDEINQYWTAYFAAVDVLMVAQSKLEQLEKSTIDLGDRSGYRADRLRVEADIELMRARRIAFNASRSPINPPSQAVVDTIIRLSEDVTSLAANRAQAAAIVNIAATAIGEFRKIQSA
jgi:hypothetical protein